jgi:superfamily II DNA or RNA helicase
VSTPTAVIPEPGQAVLVRGRPAAVRDVRSQTGNELATHLVEVEYLDGWEFPAEDTLLWEAEVDARVLHGGGLPRVADGLNPDPPERFAAFCDALRWSSVARLPGLTGDGPALVSPWESAVAPEPYQLYPVLKALEMPRVTLLLADDVGLGKTVEAGLVLRELLGRRRIRRVLVICPASLQLQWREELSSKFALDFTVLDRSATVDIQREYGMDANPWAVTPRSITSMDFLRQPDVLATFLAAAQRLERGHALAWDLLVVDEAHNLAPLGFSERSDRAKMLAEVAQNAEHRLFLTATPHNGFTASFSGLLEQLDPVRFRQSSELNDAERDQVDLVMVRRLKAELNERAEQRGEVPPFTNRSVKGIPFTWTSQELRLVEALREYRRAGNAVLATLGHRERSVGRFVFSLLTKRLLSSPYALARTWWKHTEGYADAVSLAEVEVAQVRAELQVADDEEKARREQDVVRQGAGWLSRHEQALRASRDEVSAALRELGWDPEVVNKPVDPTAVTSDTAFPPDGKWEALHGWIDERLRTDGQLTADERAIWFTEYKDTLDYVVARLVAAGLDTPQVRSLCGDSPLTERTEVRECFNDEADPIRLLVATDVAAEGLNLQTSCRYVVHYEVPWNPMRLEQRNGRVDRHGQARDVTAFHFASDEDEDVKFLDFVVTKIDRVRGDLGSVGEVIDRALEEHFAQGQMTAEELDRRVEIVRDQASERVDLPEPVAPIDERAGEAAAAVLDATAQALRIDPARLERLLGVGAGLDQGAVEPIGDGSFRLKSPPSWQRTADSSLRIEKAGARGAMPRLVFSSDALMHTTPEGRHVYRERSDTRLMRLAHPVMRRATSTLRRRLWEPRADLRRYTIATHPDIATPTLVIPSLLTLVNELREPVHAELIDLAVRLDDDECVLVDAPLDDPVPLDPSAVDAWRAWLEDRWDEIADDLEHLVGTREEQLRATAASLLPGLLKEERGYQDKLIKNRLKELDNERGQKGRDRLRRQIEKLEEKTRQLTFDPELRHERDEELRQLKEQLEGEEYRRVEERRARLRARIEREGQQLVDEVLPRRFALARCALTPVAVALLVAEGVTP